MILDAASHKIAGLTGGIASGKTTAAAMLAEAGAYIIDADRIARQVVQKGTPAWQAIRAHFGSAILLADGQIDREALGTIVFRDPNAKAVLNGIVHPHVLEVIQAEIGRLIKRHPEELLVLDVPLLIESGWQAYLSVVILVYVPEAIQKARLMQRDGLGAADAEARIRAQMPIEAKRAHADYIVDNTGSRAATRRQIFAIYEQIITGPWPPVASRPPGKP
jgi:dephospho-CoA kinase